MKFSISRYTPGVDKAPYMQHLELDDSLIHSGMMLLEALELLREQDPTIGFRYSCGEGVCGSDGININGKNALSCITRIADLKAPIVMLPMPGFPIIRDLIVDMELFYGQLEDVDPYLQTDDDNKAATEQTTEKKSELELVPVETYQSIEDRDKLDGHYECILCGCCASSCPSFWWNPDKFNGPAALLAADRFIMDSRDGKQAERLEQLKSDPYKVFRCRSIKNCTAACPKDLNPSQAIQNIKSLMLKG